MTNEQVIKEHVDFLVSTSNARRFAEYYVMPKDLDEIHSLPTLFHAPEDVVNEVLRRFEHELNLVEMTALVEVRGEYYFFTIIPG